jgi:hypothetical protein
LTFFEGMYQKPLIRIMLQKSRPLSRCIFRKTARLAVFTTA